MLGKQQLGLRVVVYYFDNAATTKTDDSVLAAMMAAHAHFGNPSGAHSMARDARRLIDDATETMAELLSVKPSEIVFTSGGTESDNLAINGVGVRPACSATEHHAVLNPVEKLGGQVLPVSQDGSFDPAALSNLDQDIGLVSIMAANNETGMVNPTAAIKAALPEGVLFHVDAVQAFCWLELKEICAAADLVSLSAHKFGGPKGVGVLVVKKCVKLAAQQLGGSQERGRRAGTHNVPGIVGLAQAAKVTAGHKQNLEEVRALRDRLADGILKAVPDCVETGDRAKKTANIVHLCFEGIQSESLLFRLEKSQIMGSAASSCSSGAMEPSHVLAAMGYSKELAGGSLRLSLGYETTQAEVDVVLDVLPDAVAQIRNPNG